MATLSFATGPTAYVPGVSPISDFALGARYVSFDNPARFLAQTDGMNLGLIAWPGGALAELREDRFGLEYDGLYAEWTGKPGLAEMMQIASVQNAALAVTLPTIRYVGREHEIAAEVGDFLHTLLGGGYGPLPRELIFEIGSEFFQHFEGPDAAVQYGGIAALMIGAITAALEDPAINTIGAEIGIAVQIGRTIAEDERVRSALTDEEISHVDYVIHHDFKYQPDNADLLQEDTFLALDAWDEANRAAGGDGTDFFFSAFNIGSWTRADVRDEWVAAEQAAGNAVTGADIDLDARTNADFEAFWQSRLSEGAYGLEHATVLIELFSVHAELDAKASAVFGVDMAQPGRLSWRDADREDHLFAGGGLVEMLYESVRGTTPLGSEAPYDKNNPVTAWGFENDDKLVVFLAAGQRPPGEVTIDIDGLGTIYRAVFADGLTAAIRPDWMEVFGIPDNPLVDETPEAESFAEAVRAPVGAHRLDGGVSVTMGVPFEVVRLAFAKTDAGLAEISAWSDSDPLFLDPDVPDQPLPRPLPEDPPLDDGDEPEEDAGSDDGGIGGAGVALALLAVLPFLLLGR
jgi:hypothetical protein